MSKFKRGEKVKILAGPRTGEFGDVDLVMSNGVSVRTYDGWHHVVKDNHIEKVDEKLKKESK